MYIDYDGSNALDDWAFSPGFDLTAGTTYTIEFYYRARSSSWYESLELHYGTSQSSAGMTTELFDNASFNHTTYHIVSVNVTPSSSGTYYFGWHAYSAANKYGIHVDDISLDIAPTCLPPTSLSSSSITYTTATISWTAPGTGTPSGYQWEVRTSGAAGSGATGLVANGTTTHPTVSANITGLAGGTTYYFYVRTDCGAGDYSSWASSSFNTLSCNVPTGIGSSAVTSTTATISWTAPASGSPSGYEYEVRSSGAAGSGATGLAASGSTTSPTVTANITGLTPATSYSIYVRTVCYAGFYSSWTSASIFTTACATITPPYTQDFASYLPNCWSETTGTLAAPTTTSGTTSSWVDDGFANVGSTGAAKVNIYSTGYDEWLISPSIDLGDGSTDYQLEFDLALTDFASTAAPDLTGIDDKFAVVISTDDGATWTSVNTLMLWDNAGSPNIYNNISNTG